MNTMRIFGIEFSTNPLHITHVLSNGRTGYDLGKDSAFSHDERFFAVANLSSLLVHSLGMDKDSIKWFDFEDSVKYGDPQATNFVQDFVSGFYFARLTQRSTGQLIKEVRGLTAYIGANSRYMLNFHFENLPPTSDFRLQLPFEGDKESTRGLNEVSVMDMFSSPFQLVKGEFVFPYGEDRLVFYIPKTVEYTEDVCRTINSIFPYLRNALAESCANIMQEKQRETVIAKIKDYVADGGGYGGFENMPNFFEYDGK